MAGYNNEIYRRKDTYKMDNFNYVVPALGVKICVWYFVIFLSNTISQGMPNLKDNGKVVHVLG